MDSNEGFLKRTAFQIASQLPEDPKDAKRVIDLVLDLAMNFGRSPRRSRPASVPGKDQAKGKADGRVTPLFAPDKANRG